MNPISPSVFQRSRRSVSSCQGQAVIEWLVTAASVLMLLSVLFEITHWFVLKEHVLLHSQRATEHAAMFGGQPSVAQTHLRQHLRPRTLRIGSVCVLDPVHLLMKDFKDRALSARLRRPVIRHNHVAAQHAHFVARGWSEGRGRQSKRTISEANILTLETRVEYPLILPWLRAILGSTLTIRTRTKAVMQSPREQPDRQCTTAFRRLFQRIN